MEIINSLDSRIITSPKISYSFEKEYIPMNIWMIGISLEKPSILLRKLSIVNSIWLGLTKKIMNTRLELEPSLGSII